MILNKSESSNGTKSTDYNIKGLYLFVYKSIRSPYSTSLAIINIRINQPASLTWADNKCDIFFPENRVTVTLNIVQPTPYMDDPCGWYLFHIENPIESLNKYADKSKSLQERIVIDKELQLIFNNDSYIYIKDIINSTRKFSTEEILKQKEFKDQKMEKGLYQLGKGFINDN